MLLLCFFLFACSGKIDLLSQLDAVFTKEAKAMKIRKNNYTDYVDYYLPSDLSEEESGKLSNTFRYGESSVIMNVNIAGIINTKYYEEQDIVNEGFFDESRSLYRRNAYYLNTDGDSREYLYELYRYEDHYLLYFISPELVFYGYVSEEDVIPLTSRILLIAKSASVKDEDVIAVYSSKDVIDYQKKQVNLFETIMPVNGVIHDLMTDEAKESLND